MCDDNDDYNPRFFFGFERPLGSENDPFWWMSIFAEEEDTKPPSNKN